MLDLRHLRHALALAELGHFARAAKACHITQPALTRSIQALESSLGVQLFDRSREGAQPTHMGRLLLRHAGALDIAAKELERDVHLARGLEIGVITVGVGPFGGAALIGPVIAGLHKQHPKLKIEVVLAPWKEMPDRVRARAVDLVVAELSDIRALTDFECLSMEGHRAYAVCRAGHPILKRKTLAVADVFSFPLAGPRLPGPAEKHLLRLVPEHLRAAIAAKGLLAIECDSSAVLKSIIADSDAISMMNLFMIQGELQRKQLVALLQLDVGLHMHYGAAWLAGRTLSPAAQAFLTALREVDARSRTT